MLSGTSAYIKHLDPAQTASLLILSIFVNWRNRMHCRSIQSINFNHNRGIKLLFRHDAIEKIAWYFFKAANIPQELSFCFYICSPNIWSLHFLEGCTTSKAKAIGIWGHNACILCHFKHSHDHWEEIKSETEPQKDFSPPLFVAFGISADFIVAVILNAFSSSVSCTLSTFLEGSLRVWLMVRCVLTYMWP